MESRFTRVLYDRSPFWLRNFYASVYGWTKNRRRFSGSYDQWATLFREAHGWSEAELEAYQARRIEEQVRVAYEKVPYWRAQLDRLGLEPKDIRSGDDLRKLPVLEKTDVVAAGRDLVNVDADPRTLRSVATSGSTGTPLQVPRPDYIEQCEWAFLRTRYRHGARPGDPYSSFAGLEIIPPSRTRPPFWIDNWANRQRMFSIFHMSEANMPAYVEALDRRYSRYFVGYSSAVYLIAEYLLRHGIRLDRPPEFMLAGSEELQPQNAQVIERAFGCRVWNRYGQVEQVGSITQYPCGHLHYDMDYSHLEFLPVGEEDGAILAEIIGTNFHDLTWPLLRYRTGDLVVYDPSDRCEAGVPGAVIRRIHGRTGRYFVLPDGSRVTNISVIAKKCRNVRLMQVVQDREGEIRVRVVKGDGFGPDDEREIHTQFRRKLGDALAIRIEYVDDIERSPTGKYVSIVNRLS